MGNAQRLQNNLERLQHIMNCKRNWGHFRNGMAAIPLLYTGGGQGVLQNTRGGV